MELKTLPFFAILFVVLSTSVRAIPVLESEQASELLVRQDRCRIPIWRWYKNPNNCLLTIPVPDGQDFAIPPIKRPQPAARRPRITTTRRATSTVPPTSTTTRFTARTTTTTRLAATTTTRVTTTTRPASMTTTTTPRSTTTTTTRTTVTSGTPIPTTTATPTTPVPTGGLTADQQSASNQYRARHGVAPFTWDASLAASAQAVANTCVFQHSQGNYGENLAAGTGNYAYTSGIDAWYNEISQYNFANPGFSSATGHFTQLVWASSTIVGCARNTQCIPQQLGLGTGFGSQATFIVCQYRPPGNVIGNFTQNVFPPA